MSRERMGLPIDRLVIATNVNDILARTLATGTYELRDVVPTSSPSMDIQVSSNFERLLFEAYGRDGRRGARADGSLAQSRRFALSSARARRRSARLFAADRADEEETAATIRTMLRETGHFVDPHTAVGVAVAEKETRDPSVPMVVLGTAHRGQVPRCGRGGLRRAAGAARLARRSRPAAGARHRAAGRSGAVERFILAASRAAREGAAA